MMLIPADLQGIPLAKSSPACYNGPINSRSNCIAKEICHVSHFF